MKRFSGVFAIALVVLCASSVAAVGRPLDRFNDRFDDTYFDDPTTTDDDLCGVVPVTTRVQGIQNGMVRLDKQGHELFRVSGRVTVTHTNEANGLFVTNRSSGQYRDIRIVDNPDGTTTIFNTNIGLPERIQTPDGTVLVKDVGRIVFATTFHFHDPADPTDDEFISNEIVSISGPHPEAESGFTLFCDVVIEALT